MHVELKALKPNPLRDFEVDPIDEERVETLAQSMRDHTFWGGVICRKVDGEIQILAGHHRVKAAIKAGERSADIPVLRDIDDAQAIQIYATENATQRGNSGTALAGMVASATRFLAKAIMTGQDVSKILETSPKGLETLRGQIASEKGLGQVAIVAFLRDVPGINDGSVQQQLANLRASGHYGRIIEEVKEDIEREHREAIKAMERAEKERIAAEEAARKAEEARLEAEAERKAAAAKARAAKEEADRKRAEAEAKRAEENRQRAEAEARLAEKHRKEMEAEAAKFDALRTTVKTARQASDKANDVEVTFDFDGVAEHFRNPHQVDVFRKVVTSDSVRPYLPVKKQAALAAQLVKVAKQQDAELSGTFIRENTLSLVLGVEEQQRKLSREEREKLRAHDWEAKAKEYQAQFAAGIRGALIAAKELMRHAQSRPTSASLYRTGEFTTALERARELCKMIAKL